jgi:anti-anti-sigma factor
MLITLLTTELIPDVDDIWLLKVSDHIERRHFDLLWPTEIRVIFEKLMEVQARKLIVDTTSIEQLGSSGLQFLIIVYRQLSGKNIPIVLRNPNKHFRRLLRNMQLDRLFEIDTGPE